MLEVNDVVAFDLREMTIANRWFIESWLIDVDVDVVKDFLRSKDFERITILIDEMTKDFCKRFDKNIVKRKASS